MGQSIIYRSLALYRLVMQVLYRGRCGMRFARVCELLRESDRTVLELCFGDVRVAEACRRRGVRWVGLDLSEQFVAYAARRGFDARRADLLAGCELPACDLCVMMGSLYHFEPQLAPLFERIRRASRRLVISEPVRNWTHAGGLRSRLARALTRAGDRAEAFRFTEATLAQALERLSREVGFTYRVVAVDRDMVVEVVWST
jgi:SAM-dependent methyltransferase